MINIYEIPDLIDNLKLLPRFFDPTDTLGGVNNRHIPKLEGKFENLTGKPSIAVNHCTNGIYLALAKYFPTTVVVPSIVFFGVVGSIVQAGHKVYFAPVDHTGNLDIDQINFNSMPDDVIVMNVHMNSRVVDLRLSDKIVIEDAASAYGTCYADGTDLVSGTPHDAVISFSYGKPLTAGEGGMIFTNNNERYYRTRRYCGLDEMKGDYGVGTFDVHESNMKFPFNAMGAALVTLQLKKFEKTLRARRSSALLLDELTSSFNQVKSYQLGNCLTYMMRFDSQSNRDCAKQYLQDNNVQSYLNHPPAHRFSGFKDFTKHNNTEASSNDYYSKVLHIACRQMAPADSEDFFRVIEKLPRSLS
jgi:dTDP-4-amino-4,6-dideoxygalactose transaminase